MYHTNNAKISFSITCKNFPGMLNILGVVRYRSFKVNLKKRPKINRRLAVAHTLCKKATPFSKFFFRPSHRRDGPFRLFLDNRGFGWRLDWLDRLDARRISFLKFTTSGTLNVQIVYWYILKKKWFVKNIETPIFFAGVISPHKDKNH